jgi:hypothetical protein
MKENLKTDITCLMIQGTLFGLCVPIPQNDQQLRHGLPSINILIILVLAAMNSKKCKHFLNIFHQNQDISYTYKRSTGMEKLFHY